MPETAAALVTAPGEEAQRIARALVESRLAACVNIVEGVQSVYWWEGKLHDERESLLILKTTEEQISAVDALLHEIHPDEVFELVVLPVTGGNPDYLAWVGETVAHS